VIRTWQQFRNKPVHIGDVKLTEGNRHVRMNTTWEVLASCAWVSTGHNLFIVGPGGLGKTFVASALCHEAFCRGYSAIYSGVPEISKVIERKTSKCRQKIIGELGGADLLVLDEFETPAMTAVQQDLLCQLLDLRLQKKSTVVVSKLSLPEWHNCDPRLVTRLDCFFSQSFWMDFQSCGCARSKPLKSHEMSNR
jgi:DNA replication protein DnaC